METQVNVKAQAATDAQRLCKPRFNARFGVVHRSGKQLSRPRRLA